jgi:hypothetical protein
MHLKGFHIPVPVGADGNASLSAVQYQAALRAVGPEVHVLTSEHGVDKYVKPWRSNTQVQWLPLAVDPVLDFKAGNRVAISLAGAFQAHTEITFAHDTEITFAHDNAY